MVLFGKIENTRLELSKLTCLRLSNGSFGLVGNQKELQESFNFLKKNGIDSIFFDVNEGGTKFNSFLASSKSREIDFISLYN